MRRVLKKSQNSMRAVCWHAVVGGITFDTCPRPAKILLLLTCLLWHAEYDLGERFDLKGPYCDSGYVDEDADFKKQVRLARP